MRTTWIVCESSKKNPCLEKIWRRGKGKGKGSEIYIYGEGSLFLSGGGEIFRILGGREVGPVFAIKGCKRGGGWVSANEGDHWNTTEP